jgi:hypothetical protein
VREPASRVNLVGVSRREVAAQPITPPGASTPPLVGDFAERAQLGLQNGFQTLETVELDEQPVTVGTAGAGGRGAPGRKI